MTAINPVLHPAQLATEDEGHWLASAGPATGGCVVLMEGDPPPGAPIGHMSFRAFNPTVEKLHVRCRALSALHYAAQ